MGEVKCTFGTRMPIDIHMLNEIIYRETKHFFNYNIYTPNFGSVPVTTKFYAAHDQLVRGTAEEEAKVADYHHHVGQTRAKGPRSKYTEPVTGSMEYGWYHDSQLVPMNRNDRRFYFPKVESPHTKVEVIIAMQNPLKKK